MYGVTAIAEEFRVSERRVRQLIERGVLGAERVAGRWILTDSDVAAFRSLHRPVGRPWSCGAAWAVLAELADLATRSTPVQRSRARARIRALTLGEVAPRLRHRAATSSWYGHPSALARAASGDVVLAGLDAFPPAKALLTDDHVHLDIYVRSDDVDRLVRQLGLVEAPDRPNLTLRAVPDAMWPFAPDTRRAPEVIAALDLVEHPDPRVRRAGWDRLTTSWPGPS